ncbi:MAG TPA: hypothetical protein PKJ98_17165 [Verrucomicrobiota bacterium]|nr:hypothetical protein [Verrucomicrobiota bacterium]
MKSLVHLLSSRRSKLLPLLVGLALAPAASAGILDDFNDNTKTGWTDFTFIPGFGLPTETGQQFRFDQPPAKQDIFSASQKTSQLYELKEGRTLEFRVDLVQGSGEDAYAVLAFIPNTGGNNPGTLAGYGLAKDPTDVLITKGIQKYFVADDTVTAELKNDNVTLVLRLAVKNGNVTVTGRVLDKDNANAVLWERTVVDTPAADMMADGSDSPAAPFITTGYFTLYCYQQYSEDKVYSVYYDNAQVFVTEATVIDDFNDNTKTAWADFTFVPGFGLPTEESQQFHFDLPPARQDIFTASQKTTKVIELKEGEQVRLEVDYVQGSGEDAFGVVAFIPNTGGNNPGTLAGYGMAKDPTDVLITKGIQKYFIDDDTPTGTLKNENVMLALTLTVSGGNVEITGEVLDKDDNNAVMWSRTFLDTPAADMLEDGTDSPAAPYITTGYFTLYCYQQYNEEKYYSVYFDNAVLHAPPSAENVAPVLTDILPEEYANFLPSSTTISFKVTDDAALSNDKISVTLNGTVYTTANGLVLTGTGNTRNVSLGGLAANVNYAAVLSAEDSGGLVTTRNLWFDTFAESTLVIEVEDYNFWYGQFIDNPIPVMEGSWDPSAYSLQIGAATVDFSDTRTSPDGENTKYRPDDPVRMQHSLDRVRAKYEAAGGAGYEVYDYAVGDIAAGEWMNYTRTFPAGNYEVYLREGLANMATGESVLEEVTGDPTQPDAATRVLGSFLGARTGFQYRNFALTDGTGQNKIVLALSGVKTLRLRQVTPDPGDGARYLNYLAFIPATGPVVDRAAVTSLAPVPDSTTATVQPVIDAVIENRTTTVNVGTVQLEVNGQVVGATVTPTATGATVHYAVTPLPASGAVNSATITFKDSAGVDVTASWQFTITYLTLDPANRQPGPGTARGFNVRMVQSDPANGALESSLERAELQLANSPTIPSVVDTNVIKQIVDMSQDGGAAGFFAKEYIVPGLEEGLYGTDDFTVEATAWLELAAGSYRFTIISDDGFKVSSGAKLSDKSPLLGFRNGGTANEVLGTFEFVVPSSGFYPFRLVWYERGGGANAEWTSVNLNTGVRTLVNDAAEPTAIKAYLDLVPPPPVKVQSSATINAGFADDATAVIDTGAKRISIPASGGIRFYRLVGASALRVTSTQLDGANVIMTYE